MADYKQTREEIIARNPIRAFMEKQGAKFTKKGEEYYCLCPFHRDGKRGNFRIKEPDQAWYCDACSIGGSIIDFLMLTKGISAGDAMTELGGGPIDRPTPTPRFAPEIEKPAPAEGAKIAKTYDYIDENGILRYQAVRLEPKDFRQRRPDGSGGWIWNLKGVERVLYNLQRVLKSAHPVWIVEGEKDANTLTEIFDVPEGQAVRDLPG
jgi:DNA primase